MIRDFHPNIGFHSTHFINRMVQFSGLPKTSRKPVSLRSVTQSRIMDGLLFSDTDFLDAGGPEGYAWNLIRSESDDLLFRHAEACGAKIFEEVKVREILFEPSDYKSNSDNSENSNGPRNPGQPVSATWIRKDSTSGSIRFKYLVDASGRHGILSTKYLKNRTFNDSFKNVASWAYWKSDNVYGPGTHMNGSPYFEALEGKLNSFRTFPILTKY